MAAAAAAWLPLVRSAWASGVRGSRVGQRAASVHGAAPVLLSAARRWYARTPAAQSADGRSVAAQAATPDLTVYYDGLCPLCFKEIEHYKKHPRAGLVRWQDITARDFDAARERLPDKALLFESLHTRKKDGQVVKGVDSFLAIWEALDDYRFLRKVVGLSALRPLLDWGYVTFAKYRVYLPQRKSDACADGQCSR